MKKVFYRKLALAIVLTSALLNVFAQSTQDAKKLLNKEFNLIPAHSRDTQYYQMESRMQTFAPDGKIQYVDVYRLSLRCVPSADPSKGDEYTCIKFTAQIKNGTEVSIPSLANWKYVFSPTLNGMDDKGQVFGIDHAKFDYLSDENGELIPIENAYHVYNAFIDFHSMSVFSEKSGMGKGIQDLKRIGDKIIHSAAYSQAPVDLGNKIGKGSYFRNGEVTLMLKGLGFVNEKSCAILEYDSGESSFYMLPRPMPGIEVTVKGRSHYWGDIYKDLTGGWIQKATLHEVVVTESEVTGMNTKMNAVVERTISITNLRHS